MIHNDYSDTRGLLYPNRGRRRRTVLLLLFLLPNVKPEAVFFVVTLIYILDYS
jgi:hypothetical protein